MGKWVAAEFSLGSVVPKNGTLLIEQIKGRKNPLGMSTTLHFLPQVVFNSTIEFLCAITLVLALAFIGGARCSNRL